MTRIALLLLASIALFGQAKQAAPVYPPTFTVSTLPSAATWSGRTAVVTDSLTAGSCTVGGGSEIAFCRSSGAAWVSLGGTAGTTYTAGTGITLPGNAITADSAVVQLRATAQSGASLYCRSTTGNATYTCLLTPTLTAYTTGGCLVLNADFANVTTATINVDTLGAKSILTRSGAALAAADVPLNKPVVICYDGTQFILQSGSGSAAGLTLLETKTASASASLDFTTCLSSTYDTYKIEGFGLYASAGTPVLYLRVSTNGGSSYISSGNYGWSAFYMYGNAAGQSGNTTAGGGIGADTKIEMGQMTSTTTSLGHNFSYTVQRPSSSSGQKPWYGQIIQWDGGTYTALGYYDAATAINAFQFVPASSTLASGTVRCYGVAK